MTFLRLLSKSAYQNFTMTCVNSAAWYNQRTFNYDQAIKLLGDNEQEFSAKGVRPNVILDGCKVSDPHLYLLVQIFQVFFFFYVFSTEPQG